MNLDLSRVGQGIIKRREGDSNPRYPKVHWFSKPTRSTTPASLREDAILQNPELKSSSHFANQQFFDKYTEGTEKLSF